MIFTVTLNPTLDRTLAVPVLRPGEIHRAQLLREDLGGKGVNVSRALSALGISSHIVGLAAGCTGQRMRDELLGAGFAVDFVMLPGETRRNLTLRDESTGIYTKINEPGPLLDHEHTRSLIEQIQTLARPGDLWAFCGSLPPGAPPDLYTRLITVVQDLGGRAVLDSSGPALALGLAARPLAIKPNREEVEEILGWNIEDEQGDGWAACKLQALGSGVVALSRGADGLALATDRELVLATPPPIQALSPVGAGDAALAGLLWALIDGCDAAETARRAVACGTAAAMQEGTGIGERALVEQLIPRIAVSVRARSTMTAPIQH